MDRRSPCLALIAFLAACGRVTTSSDIADGGDLPDTAVPSGARPRGPSFDPSRYSTSCSATADCMLTTSIGGCSRCCSETAVNAAAVEADLAAVEQACAGRGSMCDMECTPMHAECSDGQCAACTELLCRDGVLVQAPIATSGTTVIEGVIEGATMGCTLEIGRGSRRISCSPGVELVADGTLFRTKTTSTVTFRVTHDGVLVASTTFAPVYIAEPGPNGPQCEPKECLVARATFP